MIGGGVEGPGALVLEAEGANQMRQGSGGGRMRMIGIGVLRLGRLIKRLFLA
jgi:hypothetical protein